MQAMQRLGRTVLIPLGLGACVTIGMVALPFADYVVATFSAPQMARTLAPPEYPGSQFLSTYQRTGTESMGDWRTYSTTDSIGNMLAFMEEHMPGFVMEHNSAGGTIYRNYKEDKSDLAKRAADYACSSLFCTTFNTKTYPSVEVTLYSDPNNSTGTLIDVHIDWPAP
jgi:hypothetical protein